MMEIIFFAIVIILLFFVIFILLIKNKNKQRFILTDEFKSVVNLIENTNKHLFITGKAGTGKSTLLKYIKNNSKKRIAIVAPTGIAALNIGGVTTHRFFQIPIPLEISLIRRITGRALYCNIDVIIIDEVSMLRVDMLDWIDGFLRKNALNEDLPFGGIQMVFIGDLFQLPPVVKNHELNDLNIKYKGIYFFNAPVFKDNLFINNFKFIDLKKVFRQNDLNFITFLNNVRFNNITSDDINYINKRFGIKRNKDDAYVYVTTTNASADLKNKNNLNSLPGDVKTYNANISGDFIKIQESQFPSPQNLILKKNAQVIFTKNGPDLKWVNGTIGIVKKIDDRKIIVEIKKEVKGKIKKMRINVPKEIWKNQKYRLNNNNELELIVTGTFEQFPLKLAWAITIHKSQGQTLDNIVIDMGPGAFAPGQTYVALSRCRSYEGIFLDAPLSMQDIFIDQNVVDFYNTINHT